MRCPSPHITWHHNTRRKAPLPSLTCDTPLPFLSHGRAAERFEQVFEQPATEESIWRAAALYRLHGAFLVESPPSRVCVLA